MVYMILQRISTLVHTLQIYFLRFNQYTGAVVDVMYMYIVHNTIYIIKMFYFNLLTRQFCDYAMMGAIFGTICVYIIFISESIHDVVNFAVGIDWDIRVYIAMVLVPLIIIGQVS